MKNLDLEPLYKLSIKGLSNPDEFKKQANYAVREIFDVTGGEADVQVQIEPEVKSKGLFTVSISADALGKPIVVKKTGRRIHTLLRQAKKTVVKLCRRSFAKRIKTKRQPVFVANAFSFREAS